MTRKATPVPAESGVVVSTIDTLVPATRNGRRRTERNRRALDASLRAVGLARSIAIDEKNQIMAGNGTTESAKRLGFTKLKVVDAAGDELVAVRRTGLTEQQKRALAIYDNRAGELSEWDSEVLVEELAAIGPVPDFYTDDELLKLSESATVGEIKERRIVPPPEVAWVLLAIPATRMAEAQPLFEALQLLADVSAQVMRKAAKP